MLLAARDIRAGEALSQDALRPALMEGEPPEEALRSPQEAQGLVASEPIRKGQIILRSMLGLSPSRRGIEPGEWPVYIPLKGPETWGGFVRPGDRVAVVLANEDGTAETVAVGLRVIGLQTASGEPAFGSGAGGDRTLISVGPSEKQPSVAVLAAPPDVALRLDGMLGRRSGAKVVLHVLP